MLVSCSVYFMLNVYRSKFFSWQKLLTNSQDVTNFSITGLSPKEPVGMSVTISPVCETNDL